MASEPEAPTLGRVSSESVRKATGRGWPEWLVVLDAAGAEGWDHKEIVAYLEAEHPRSARASGGSRSRSAREAMRVHWREALERIAKGARS